VYDVEGRRITAWEPTGPRPWLTGLAVSEHDVFVADSGNRVVLRFAVEGFCGCCNPIAIALTPEGHYVTCEKGLPRVKLYDPQGVLKCVVAGPESFAANRRLNAGAGRADPTLAALDAVVDRRGHIYILDRAANDIREMAPKVSPKTA